MKILASVVILLLALTVTSQVIGIDFGTQFWKASLISPGKNLVIVENSRSGRKSHNGIAFLDGVRHFEYDALQKRLKKPKVSYFYLNKLIESLDHDQSVEGFTFKNGSYYFKEAGQQMSLEQLVGMILKNVKKYGSNQAGSDIKDAVLTMPAHWGFKAKFSLINAAAIADLNVLGIVNENSAAAIHFAITRNDSDPVNIGFFNMGSHNLQISIVQFFGTYDEVREKNIESMKVLSHVSVPTFGGLQFDELLAQHVAAEFKAKHKLDVHENIKSWTKLLNKCADLKETLSANKEATIYIQGLINGIDLNVHVKREVIEKSPIFEKLQGYLQEALDKAGITKDDMNSVEVIGGGSRVPLIGKMLKEFFDPVEVGSHINGDESMAFGAALRAANLSIAFRVKQLHFYDGNPEPIRAVITNIEDGVISQNQLYDQYSEQGLRKEVVVDENEEDVKVSIFYGQEIVQEYMVSNVSQWRQKYNQTALNFTEQPKLILVFTAHSYNFAQLKEAYINITLNTSTTRDIYETIKENVTIEVEVQDKEETKQETAENATASAENKQGEEQVETEQKAEDEAAGDTPPKKKTKKKVKEQERSVKKTIDDFKIENKKVISRISHEYAKYPRYSRQQLDKLREIISKYEKHENYLKEKSKIRNDFESTLYALKDDFENPGLKHYSTEDELERLKSSVSEQITWLDDNAWTAEKQQFEKHFKIIQDIYMPIVNRSSENRDREKYYNKSIQILSLVYSKTVELNNSHPWVQEKAEAHLKKINDTVEYIYGKVKEQFERKANQDVTYYNHQMIQRAEDLRDEYYLIKMTPRPKVTKKVETEAPKEPTADENLDLSDNYETGEPKQEHQNQEDQQQPSEEENQAEDEDSKGQQEEEKKPEDL